MEHKPMLHLLFHGSSLYGNLYSVALFMSIEAFTRYMHQTYCHVDYDVNCPVVIHGWYYFFQNYIMK